MSSSGRLRIRRGRGQLHAHTVEGAQPRVPAEPSHGRGVGADRRHGGELTPATPRLTVRAFGPPRLGLRAGASGVCSRPTTVSGVAGAPALLKSRHRGPSRPRTSHAVGHGRADAPVWSSR